MLSSFVTAFIWISNIWFDLWLHQFIQPMLSLFIISTELPYWILEIVTDPLTIRLKLELFSSSQVFMFINIEFHPPFYHSGILFSIMKCFTISSSFQGPERLVPLTSFLVEAILIWKGRTWLEFYVKILHKHFSNNVSVNSMLSTSIVILNIL